jgi:hypothetical protein
MHLVADILMSIMSCAAKFMVIGLLVPSNVIMALLLSIGCLYCRNGLTV